MSTIAVIGTGYVGLTTGAYLAHLGHRVTCADIFEEKVARLREGDIPILEAGLEELVAEGLGAGRLDFVVGAAGAVEDAEFVFLCVQTPQGEDGSADLTYIREAAAEIRQGLRPEAIVINKSTVPVGSTRVVEQAIGRDDVFVVSNPEFLREGSAVHDCLHPDRIVIGSDDQAAAMRVAALFESLKAPLVITDPASAETIKYASNAFLATKVSYVNALANVCEAVGADVREVVLGMGYDKRIGFEFLKPGPGWGGSCFVGEESVLARRADELRLWTFAELFAEVERVGPIGWEVLSWRVDEPTPELLPVQCFTARPYVGDVVEVHTKMGRRVTVTPDHPFVTGPAAAHSSWVDEVDVVSAEDLSTTHWLPVAQGFPLLLDDRSDEIDLLAGLAHAGLTTADVIVRLSPEQLAAAEEARMLLAPPRRWEMRRNGTLRLDELDRLGVSRAGGMYGTTTNGTYVPASITLDEWTWSVLGLYLADGHCSTDGSRTRLGWSFHPREEEHLVQEVAGLWRDLGVKVSVDDHPTTRQVLVSSRILAGWFSRALGRDRSTKRLPDEIWSAPTSHKERLLHGLWDGDGSWSKVGSGPSVVLEYGTVSRQLADGMLRLLGDLGVVARLEVGRTARSAVDTYRLVIAGAAQVEDAGWLLAPAERRGVGSSITGQAKRIAPAGYRRSSKNAAWVRVVATDRRPFAGTVYSLEVPGSHTVVSSYGLVVHNCFPKDTRALVRIAEDAGYEFGLLRGVITVNDEQYERMTSKVERMLTRPVEGAAVAVWGLTFKARTDDLRDSPSIEVIRRLQAKGAVIKAYDPAITAAAPVLEGIEVLRDPYAVCEGADVLVVLTEWDEFRWLDFAKVAGLMRSARLVDTRNLLEPAAVRRRGFTYDGLGRA